MIITLLTRDDALASWHLKHILVENKSLRVTKQNKFTNIWSHSNCTRDKLYLRVFCNHLYVDFWRITFLITVQWTEFKGILLHHIYEFQTHHLFNNCQMYKIFKGILLHPYMDFLRITYLITTHHYTIFMS